MTTVLSTLFISLDGVAEIDPDWHFPYFDEAMGKAVGQDYADTDVLVLGRVTYDSFAGAWPERGSTGAARRRARWRCRRRTTSGSRRW